MDQKFFPILKIPFTNKKLFYSIIVLLPLVLYFNTLFNNYALDDSIVITDNVYVKKGVAGINEIFSTETFTGFFKKKKDLVEGGRYRPLSVATFAIEYELWKLNPALSHFINILLYALLCLVLLKFLEKILFFLGENHNYTTIAFFAALIFAIHPVHTEVVANIKGRDEILAVLFSLLSLLFMMRCLEYSPLINGLISGLMLFMALLSKENALTVIPISLILILFNLKSIKPGKAVWAIALLFVPAFIYLIIRQKVVGGFSGNESNELMNNPFLYAQAGQKSATIFYTLLLYLKLLVFPHPLTYDYYPYHIMLHNWNNFWVLLSFVIQILILLTAFIFIKRNKIISFGIFFYLITLLPVSNLLINIGSFMNERFLFLPSIGFSLLAGTLLFKLLFAAERKWIPVSVSILLIAILSVFSGITIARNTKWKDNFTLFTHDVKISQTSAKGNCTAGGILLEKAQTITDTIQRKQLLDKSIAYLNKSVNIYPGYVDALLLLGNAHFELDKNIPEVLVSYRKLFHSAPGHELALSNLKKMLATTENPAYRKLGYTYILKLKPRDFDANYQLGTTYGKMLGQMDSSIFYLKKALNIDPESKMTNRDLGVAYAMSGKFKESVPFFEKVLSLEPNDPGNYINLGITYHNLDRFTDAQAMFNKAEELKKTEN